MRRFCALYGILSPLPQRPFCVVGRGWGEGKMKVRGRKGGGEGESVPPPIVYCVLAIFLFFNYYFSPVVYPFSCREQYRLKSLIMLGIHRPEFALWQNFCTRPFLTTMTGEILNWKLVKFVAGIVAMWREETSGNLMRKKGKLNCSRPWAIIIAGKAFTPVDNYSRRSY